MDCSFTFFTYKRRCYRSDLSVQLLTVNDGSKRTYLFDEELLDTNSVVTCKSSCRCVNISIYLTLPCERLGSCTADAVLIWVGK